MAITAPLSSLFAQERATYEAHKSELLQSSRGKIVVIQGTRILGTFDTDEQALEHAYRKLGRSRFLVRPVQEEEERIYLSESALTRSL